MLEVWGFRAEGIQRGKNWENCNSIINKKLFKNSSNEIILSHPTYSSPESRVARSYPGSSGHKVGPTLNRTIAEHTHPHIHSHSLTHSLTHSDWDNWDTHSTLKHISGMWEETRVPEENPCRHGENVHPPHSRPSYESIFSHQHYNEMTLNETRICCTVFTECVSLAHHHGVEKSLSQTIRN